MLFMSIEMNCSDFSSYKKELLQKAFYYVLLWGWHLLTLRWRKSRTYFNRMKGMIFAIHTHNYPTKCEKSRIAVYTVLYGEYDNIKPIMVKNNSLDYFAFTDQPVADNSGWIKRTFDFPTEINNDNVLKSRYLRMHPHLLFPEYDYSIYIDASFIIKHDIFYLLGRLGNNDIAMFQHPWANDIYDEAELVIHWKRADENITRKQVERYRVDGYPKGFGMTTTGIIVCRCNNATVTKIMQAWWDEFKKTDNTKRDQMCLFYVIWKLGLCKNYIKLLGTRVYDDPIVWQNSWYESKKP